MVKINRTPKPDDIVITSDEHYRNGPAHDIIRNDFNNKCYICECKSNSMEIEHRNPDKSLRYCWDNLFYACRHCNSIKGTSYADIIDCTIIDPEEHIELSLELFPSEMVAISQQNGSCLSIGSTLELLRLVYGGAKTKVQIAGFESMLAEIKEELVKLQEAMIMYLDNNTDQSRKEVAKEIILKLIDKNAKYAAIKRTIIRSVGTYKNEFGQYL